MARSHADALAIAGRDARITRLTQQAIEAEQTRDALVTALELLAYEVEHPLKFGHAEQLAYRLGQAHAAIARATGSAGTKSEAE